MTVIKTYSISDRHVAIIQNACFKKLGLKSLYMAVILPLNPGMSGSFFMHGHDIDMSMMLPVHA